MIHMFIVAWVILVLLGMVTSQRGGAVLGFLGMILCVIILLFVR